MFPPEPDIPFRIATGESMSFVVWQDRESNTKLVKCDICDTLLCGAKQSTEALNKHRGNKTCHQVAMINETLGEDDETR